nr:putative retrotransposon Ty1-copia subclass protein [Tanacetum cinerariifolium]
MRSFISLKSAEQIKTLNKVSSRGFVIKVYLLSRQDNSKIRSGFVLVKFGYTLATEFGEKPYFILLIFGPIFKRAFGYFIQRSTRIRHAPDRMGLYIDAEEHELGDLGEPANYRVALLDPESDKWLNAMNVKMQTMKDNEVWVLVELPPNGKTIGSKWLFKKKTDMDGVVHTYKSPLVAKGYTQTPGIDYEKTFSPVADIRTIGILIAIAAYYDYEICIPMQEKLKLSKSQGTSTPAELKRMQNVQYASVVGSIMYDVRCTRPDVAFAQNVTSRFQQNPVYGGDLKRELKVSCYTDDGYLTDARDLKSQTGYVFVLNGGAVDWKNAKQSIFATSSAEA